jgi:hypothetical protein
MEGTGIQSFVAFHAQIPRFAKTGITPWRTALKGTALSKVPRFATSEITPWQSALKFRILAVVIRGTNIFFLAIRILNTTVCHNPWYTIERGLPQRSEIQYPPFYIDRPHVRGAVSF